MPLTLDEVKKIADLAKLNIEDRDMSPLTENLERILQLVDEMKAVDTSNVEPLAHPLEETQSLRVDQVTETNHSEAFQKIAPEVYAGLYIVPQVIEAE
jgi:aspartyl-tRNA(Asn)/glutamyl-tRNA(Gln) amidotransferase subunit C